MPPDGASGTDPCPHPPRGWKPPRPRPDWSVWRPTPRPPPLRHRPQAAESDLLPMAPRSELRPSTPRLEPSAVNTVTRSCQRPACGLPPPRMQGQRERHRALGAREAAVPDARSARLMAAETDVTPLSSADVRPGERRAARLAAAESPVLPMTQEQGLRATSRIVAGESEVLPLTRPWRPVRRHAALARRTPASPAGANQHPAPAQQRRRPGYRDGGSRRSQPATAGARTGERQQAQPPAPPQLRHDRDRPPPRRPPLPTTSPTATTSPTTSPPPAKLQPRARRQTPVGPHRRPHQQTPRPATRPRPQAPLQPMRHPALRPRRPPARRPTRPAQPGPAARRPQPAPRWLKARRARGRRPGRLRRARAWGLTSPRRPSAAASAAPLPLNLNLPRGPTAAAHRPGLIELLPQPPELARKKTKLEKASKRPPDRLPRLTPRRRPAGRPRPLRWTACARQGLQVVRPWASDSAPGSALGIWLDHG